MKRALCVILALYLLLTICSASEIGQLPEEGMDSLVLEVLSANRELSSHWVNWTPSDWDKCVQIRDLADAMRNMADSAEELPRIVHNWVCENIYFDQDAVLAGEYSILSPEAVLETRRGVCEAIANLTQALLLEMDIPCIKVWGTAIEEGGAWKREQLDLPVVNHTWNEFYLNGKWAAMDCSIDMGNRYIDGEFLPAPWQNVYLDPSEFTLAKTHLCIRRGILTPSNTPSEWALEEIASAVDAGLIPVTYLSDYHGAISGRDLRLLFGLDGGSGENLTRTEAASMIAELLPAAEDSAAFADLEGAERRDREAVSALRECGIVRGAGGRFLPNEPLSREQAICLRWRYEAWRGRQ